MLMSSTLMLLFLPVLYESPDESFEILNSVFKLTNVKSKQDNSYLSKERILIIKLVLYTLNIL
jgi:hypothetical protein